MSGFYDENNFNSNIPTPPQAPPMPGVNRPQPQPQPEPESETQVYQPPQAPRINPQPARPAYENPQNPNTAYAYYNPPQAPRAPMPPQQGYAPYYPPQAPTYQRPPVPPVPPVQPVQPTTPTPIIIPTTPYEEPTQPDPEQGGTIIFSNNKGFSTVNIYYWSEADQSVEWPGVPMTSIGMNQYGEERFTFEMPAGMTNYIINDGGTQQTVDIPFTGSTGVYMTDKDAEGHYLVEFYELSDTPVDPTPTPDPTPSAKDVTFEPGEASASDPAWFAWVWNDNSEGTWIKGTASGSNVVFSGAADYGNILVVRMKTGSESADWDTCWNQSEDMKMQSGTLYFTGWGSDNNKFTIGWK